MLYDFARFRTGLIYDRRLGVVANEDNLKPTTPMYFYPFSNVSGDDHLCIGNNPLPTVKSLHTLGSLTYFILSMDNNNDHFNSSRNKQNLEMRDLMELLKNEQQSYYYENILKPNGITLGDFVGHNW